MQMILPVCTSRNILNLLCRWTFWKLTSFAKGDISTLFLDKNLRRKYFDRFREQFFQI